MSKPKGHKYKPIPLEEIVVVKNPPQQVPNGTDPGTSTSGNDRQSSIAERRSNGTEPSSGTSTSGNDWQSSIAERRSNGTEPSPGTSMSGNDRQPSIAERRTNGTEPSPGTSMSGNDRQPSIAERRTNGTEPSPGTSTSGNDRQPSIAAPTPTRHDHQATSTTRQAVNVCTELHLASQRLDAERVSLLLQQGAEVNALEVQSFTPLDVVGEKIPSDHESPVESFLKVIRALTAKGGRPTPAPDRRYRETPVHVAVKLACAGRSCTDCSVCSQCLEAIDILAEHGYKELLQYKPKDNATPFNVNDAPKNPYKKVHTALHAAVHQKWMAGVNKLLSLGTDVNTQVFVPAYSKGGVKEKRMRRETVLHLAVYNKWAEGVATLIQHGADTNAVLCKFSGGYTPLHMASQRVDVQCVELLLAVAETNPNVLDCQGLTALDVVGLSDPDHPNPEDCFLRVIGALIDRGAQPTTEPNAKYREYTPIQVAVALQSFKAIDILYKCGYNQLLQNKDGKTALHKVTSDQSMELLNVLVSLYKETGLDTKNKSGETALHIAVKKAWFDGVKLLLDSGADIAAKTPKDKTVLHLLPHKNNYVILEELLAHRDRHKIVNEKDSSKILPLCAAILAKHPRCVFSLVNAGADVSLKHGGNDSTVLHCATSTRQPDVLKGLFMHNKSGMDLIKEYTVTTNVLKDATPLHFAVFFNDPKSVEILVKNKCNLRAKCNYENKDYTALQLASIKGYEDIVKLLINEPDSTGMMPIHWACIHHHLEIIKRITDAGFDLSTVCVNEENNSKSTAMDLFINRVPGAVDLLGDILDSCITVHKENIKFDYKILSPALKDGSNSRQLKVLDALVQTGNQVNQSRLFAHPVVETFLRLQWERMNKFYIGLILVFLVFLVIPFTVLLTIVFYLKHNLSDFPVWGNILYLSMCFGFIIYIIHEALYFSFKTQNSRYFCNCQQLSKEFFVFIFRSVTWVLKLIFISIILFLPFTNPSETFYRELAACAIIMLGLESMLLISRVPTYGIYMLMFFKVTSNCFVVMLSFMGLFFGFVATFLIEYRGEAPFNSITDAFLKTMVMMTSEMDYSSLFDTIKKDTVALPFSKLVFLIFLLIVGVVIMNIVLAKAISDVKKVGRLRQQAEFLSTYEQLLTFLSQVLLRVSGLCRITCSTRMAISPVVPKLVIRFDESNRFHNNLMQSIMEKAYHLTKARQKVPKEDEVMRNIRAELNEFKTHLNKTIENMKNSMIDSLSMKLDSLQLHTSSLQED